MSFGTGVPGSFGIKDGDLNGQVYPDTRNNLGTVATEQIADKDTSANTLGELRNTATAQINANLPPAAPTYVDAHMYDIPGRYRS